MSTSQAGKLSMEGRVDVEAPSISSTNRARVGAHDASEFSVKERAGGDLCLAIGDLAIDSKEAADGGSQAGATPEPLFYVLPHLGLKELLILETVSRQLRDAIRGDVLLWQQLQVDAPVNKNFTNVELVRLASRAQGRLRSLCLVNCTRISEEVVEKVVASNPLLQKLSLPGCTRVSAESLLRMVKMQTLGRSPESPVLTQLRIRGLYGITTEILDSLLKLLHPEGNHHSTDANPQYYKNGEPSPAIKEERAIDIDTCPKCRKAGLVFDCTRPTCQQRRTIPLQQCRGCYLCIARCEECGTCIDGEDYEDTFCLEILCQSCWLRLPKCLECNRAGCSRHADALRISEQGSFTCESCRGALPGETGPIFE